MAEHLTERALSISERFRPVFEFLALLDRAGIWAARGRIHDALAAVDAARLVLAGTKSVLLARADELEALLRLSLGDLRSAVGLASGLPLPGAACCWPGSRSPPAITTLPWNTWTRRRWGI
jgi:LuxR family transcriptional regulator, maltose regulon positive regulatory protein